MVMVRQYNALIRIFLHIPHPDELTDEQWEEAVAQIDWASESGLLGVKLKK